MAGQAVEFPNRQVQQGAASTTVPLAHGASFSSTWLTAGGFARITGTVYTDQPSTLYVYQSPDASHGDWVDQLSVSAATPTKFSYEVVGPFFLVQLTNTSGTTNQTYLRLNTYLRRI
jgi:hypothetical protein